MCLFRLMINYFVDFAWSLKKKVLTLQLNVISIGNKRN